MKQQTVKVRFAQGTGDGRTRAVVTQLRGRWFLWQKLLQLPPSALGGRHVGSTWPGCSEGYVSTSPWGRFATAASQCPATQRWFYSHSDLEIIFFILVNNAHHTSSVTLSLFLS